MTLRSLHFLLPVPPTVTAFFPTSVASETVNSFEASLRFLLNKSYSQLNRTYYKWDFICYPGSTVACYWSLGRLWPLEVGSASKSAPRLTEGLFNRPNITIFFTILAVSVSFGWLGVEDPSQWRAGVALYILGRT